jgi:hypothetical protein
MWEQSLWQVESDNLVGVRTKAHVTECTKEDVHCSYHLEVHEEEDEEETEEKE